MPSDEFKDCALGYVEDGQADRAGIVAAEGESDPHVDELCSLPRCGSEAFLRLSHSQTFGGECTAEPTLLAFCENVDEGRRKQPSSRPLCWR
jgi:hypothetical protein